MGLRGTGTKGVLVTPWPAAGPCTSGDNNVSFIVGRHAADLAPNNGTKKIASSLEAPTITGRHWQAPNFSLSLSNPESSIQPVKKTATINHWRTQWLHRASLHCRLSRLITQVKWPQDFALLNAASAHVSFPLLCSQPDFKPVNKMKVFHSSRCVSKK